MSRVKFKYCEGRPVEKREIVKVLVEFTMITITYLVYYAGTIYETQKSKITVKFSYHEINVHSLKRHFII